MKPVKSDFPNFVEFTLNIADGKINTHINDAFKYEIKPKLDVLADDILSYNANLTTKPELKAFFNDYILQWWVLLAYRRFMITHGRNVTQFGYTKTKDAQGTFDQVDQIERSVILKQLQHDADVCYTYVLQQTWTFDNIAYRKPCKNTGSNFGINALE